MPRNSAFAYVLRVYNICFSSRNVLFLHFSSLQLELNSREKSVMIVVCFLIYVVEMTKQSGLIQLRDVIFIIKFEYSWFYSPLTFILVIDGKREFLHWGRAVVCSFSIL